MTELNSIPQQRKFKILLIGDSCIDIYQYGEVTKISPEAPVPVFVPSDIEMKMGMASNVLNNLKNLGCDVDSHLGKESKKTRLIDSRSKQHLLRIDEDVETTPLWFDIKKSYDAIVISDYDKGSVSYEFISHIIQNQTCPIFIDTKKTELKKFDGAFVKINAKEYYQAKNYCKDLIVTHGSKGAKYKNKTYPAKPVEVSDVCGAGDTFLAALVYEYLNTNDIHKAIQFANKASAVTVQHMGVYAPTLGEICD